MSGIPEKLLRVRENNRRQLGKRSPHKDRKHQSVEDYLLDNGAINVYHPRCGTKSVGKPFITLRLRRKT
jgi:hypothetical protein